ncbi:MAG: hypothetical protein ACK4PC_05605 [Sphingopyxis sp.]
MSDPDFGALQLCAQIGRKLLIPGYQKRNFIALQGATIIARLRPAIAFHNVSTHCLRFEGEQLVERRFFGDAVVVGAAGDREEQPDLGVGAATVGDRFKARPRDSRVPALQRVDAFLCQSFGIVIAQLHCSSCWSKKRGRNKVPTPNLFRSRRD